MYWKNSDTLVITGVDTTKNDLLKTPFKILNSNKIITVIYQNEQLSTFDFLNWTSEYSIIAG
jgi:hypothetical protein